MAVVLTAAGVVMLRPYFGTVQSPPPAAPAATPQPAVITPAPLAPSTAAAIREDDYAKNAVKNALRELCSAYEALDPDAAQQVFPKINMAVLRNQLNKSQYKSVTCTFGEPTFQSVDPAAGTAKIRVDVTRVFEHSALDPKPDVSEQIASMTFSRAGLRGRWVVESAEYGPKPKPNGVRKR